MVGKRKCYVCPEPVEHPPTVERPKADNQLTIFAGPPAVPDAAPATTSHPPLRAVSLFSGIGGFELGLRRAGHHIEAMCEIWDPAVAVLKARFPEVTLHHDVCALRALPADVDLVSAGFPCQDLSQAGMTAGIAGDRSGLVYEVFRLLHGRKDSGRPVPWVILENVPFMLQLQKGHAMDVIVTELERLGYKWAYRVVNSRAFGLPQRRERVYLVAAHGEGDPRDVLLSEDVGEPEQPSIDKWRDYACGFYWTEGRGGLGWAFDSVPTLKGGSTVGIPSPPAIVRRTGDIVTPDVRDAERMQGFPVDWTNAAETGHRRTHRWKLVGNAVTVDAAAWLGHRLIERRAYDASRDQIMVRKGAWPKAAWNVGSGRHTSDVSAWPCRVPGAPLDQYLQHPTVPLSERATAGFYARALEGTLKFAPGFLDLVKAHRDQFRVVAAK